MPSEVCNGTLFILRWRNWGSGRLNKSWKMLRGSVNSIQFWRPQFNQECFSVIIRDLYSHPSLPEQSLSRSPMRGINENYLLHMEASQTALSDIALGWYNIFLPKALEALLALILLYFHIITPISDGQIQVWGS